MRKLRITSLSIILSAGLHSASAYADPSWSDPDITNAIESGMYGTVTSLVIMDDGDLVYEGYFNGADAETLHNTRSATKTVTGIAAGVAHDQGILTVDTPVAKLFADVTPFENPDARKAQITQKDLLTMSSVMECNDSDQFSRGNESRMHNVEDWTSFFWDLPIRGYPSWALPPERSKHGRAFSYCSAGVEIAGQAVERASGETIQDYLDSHVFGPMSIESYEWQINGQGDAHKSGGLGMTSRDLAKLAEMHRMGGLHDGKRILSSEWVEQATRAHVVSDAERDMEYGYLWWLGSYDVGDTSHGTYFMSGNGGNRVIVMPDHGLVVVVTNTDYNQRGMHQKTQQLVDELIVGGLPEAPHKE